MAQRREAGVDVEAALIALESLPAEPRGESGLLARHAELWPRA